ncbi:AMP deaminase 2 [Bonamia ostreae]|uniref:AMP deaminase 2 n=1 Tax=Bonamia ostreae TaxID=126728 RepID=A0ABV2AKJ9_9EUKA
MDESYKLDRYPSQNILTESPTFQKVKITNKSKKSHEAKIVCDMIKNMLSIREKYQKDMQTQIPKYSLEEIADTKNLNSPPRLDTELSLKDGVYHVRTRNEDGDEEEREVISRDEFFGDLADLMKLVSKGAAKSLAYNRLKILCARFDLHVILNDMSETEEVKMFPHKDFYNIIKVDNHVHHSACMNQKQFLRFVKRKVRTESSVIVTKNEDGKEMSLGEVAKSLGISQYNLSIDYLDMHVFAKETF